MINEENNLDDFSFTEMSSEVDFFNQEEIDTGKDKTDVISVIEEISKDDELGEEGKDKGTNPPVTKEVDLFGEDTVNTKPEGSEEEEEEDTTSAIDNPNTFILNKLKEKGLIDFELEENEELTEELAEELLVDKFDESVENKVAELMTELPDEKKQAVQFLLKGGNLSDLANAFSNDASIDLNVDLEKEEVQLSVLKKLLKLEDKDDEEIEAEIEFLKDSGKLKTMTEKKFNKYKKEVEEDQKEFLDSQETAKEEEKKAIKLAKGKIASFLTENEAVNGIKFSKDDKKILPSYMNDKSIKLQNGSFITQMQKELFYDLPKNQEALIQLATLLKNRNEDGSFNFESIVKDTRTKVTREVKQNVRRDNTSIPGNSTIKGKESNKSLSDYFDK